MSDDYFFENQSRKARLRDWALGQMLKGAGTAAAALVLLGTVLFAIYAISLLLPEESKQAPSPYSALEIAQPASDTV